VVYREAVTRPVSPAGEDRPEDPYRPLRRELRYAEPIQGVLLRAARRRVARICTDRQAERVLDVCCGTGGLSRMLARQRFEVLGVDASETMLGLAKARPRKRLAYEHCDATDLRHVGEFDVAVGSLALHEMTEPARLAVWRGMGRALRPGGVRVAVDYALPRGSEGLAGFARRWIARDERGFTSHDPTHYENYRDFMERGGIAGWLAGQGTRATSLDRYWAGNLAVVSLW